MLSSEKQAIIREIWNSRFNIHSLRPLQSKVTHVTEDNGVPKFHVEHRIIPTPIPAEMITHLESTRKRELKFKPRSLYQTLKERQIRVIAVSKHLPLEEAVIARLRQLGIIIHELTVERVGDKKTLFMVKVLKSPYVSTEDFAKLTIHLTDEDLSATEFLDGDYNNQTKSLQLNPSSYSRLTEHGIKYFYGSMVSWVRNSNHLKVKVITPCYLNLYGKNVADLNDYKNHLAMDGTIPIFSEKFEAEEHFELRFEEDKTLFTHKGETIELEAVDKRLALSVADNSVVAKNFNLEITSMEPV